MQWEIVVAVILAIGICTAIIEVWAKRMARRNERKDAEAEQNTAKEAAKK